MRATIASIPAVASQATAVIPAAPARAVPADAWSGAAALAAPAGLPRLLADVDWTGGATRLARHRRTYPAPPTPRAGRPREELVAAAERSGLRGRGGASFPTGVKLRTVSQGRRPPVVVVNGAEGEPSSGKDKLLLTMAPHLVLDGALLAAAAVGATEVVVCVDERAGAALEAVGRALGERAHAEPGAPVRLAAIPSWYLAGEETALVNWLNGGPSLPTRTPPRPFQRGVDGAPTLIDNVETLAHLAQVLRFGPAWFRELGTADEPGSALVTVSGAVAHPGVAEVPIGASLAELIDRAGGPPGGPAAVLVGGYFGGWLRADQATGARLCNASLRDAGASLGCGAVVVLGERGCGLWESSRILDWLAGQSSGQCGPCVYGLAAVARTTRALHDGAAGLEALDQLRHWAGQIDGRGACRLPDGAVRLLRSVLDVFAVEIHDHLRAGGCPASARRGVRGGEARWR
jgi:NADH:ubiquinone oxidoreductase subunit F (NADH-binding)